MRLRLLGAAAALLSAVSPASAQDYLAPWQDDPYQLLLRNAFADVQGEDASLWVTVIPNSGRERAIALIRAGETWKVVTLEPRVHLWRYHLAAMIAAGEVGPDDVVAVAARDKELRELRRGLPRRPEDVRLERCERKISPAIAAQLRDAWHEMLRFTAIDKDAPIYFHATSYDFALSDQGAIRRGWIYGGNSGRARQLIDLAQGMSDYCARKVRAKSLADLAIRIEAAGPPVERSDPDAASDS
jgi:hypothetical protein